MLRRGTLRAYLVLLTASFLVGIVACSGPAADREDEPEAGASGSQDTLSELERRFPAATALLRRARPDGVVADGPRPRLRPPAPASSGPWRATRRALEAEIEGPERYVVRGARGIEIGVERPGIGSIEAAGDHVVLRDGAGALAGAFFATARGVEELIVGRGSQRYRLELPDGWRLRQPRGRDELVELRDARGTPQVRFEARWAFDEEGGRHALRVRVEGDALVVEAPADRGPLLIDPEWVDAGMPSAGPGRTGAMVSPLRDGRVLLVGGGQVGGSATADVFDPATRTFEALPDADYARVFGTATLLRDGRVLLAGGPLSGAVSPLEVFEPDTEQFIEIQAGGLAGGVAHTATRLTGGPHHGKILLAGGLQDVQEESAMARAELFLFDPSDDSVSSAGTMLEARGSHRAVLLPGGEVLFVGGFAGADSLASIERYDPVAQTSEIVAALPSARHSTTALLLPQLGAEGQLLVAGGYTNLLDGALGDAWLFDVASGQWTSAGALGVERGGIFSALLPSGDALLLAGSQQVIAGGGATGAERFDAASGTLAPLPAPPNSFAPPIGTILANGDHQVIGGDPLIFLAEEHRTIDVSTTMATAVSEPSVTALVTGEVLITEGEHAAALFDPVTRAFTDLPAGPPGIRRWHQATTLLDGRVLITGGASGLDPATKAAALFDPHTRTFTATGSMARWRAAHVQTLLLDGRVLVVGGFLCPPPDCPEEHSLEIYDPDSGSFTEIELTLGVSEIVFGHALMLADGNVWIWGGFGPNGPAPPNAFKLDPKTLSVAADFELVPNGTGVRIPDGRLLQIDGAGVGSLRDATGKAANAILPVTFWRTPPTRTPAVVPLPSGRVLVVGADEPQLHLVDPLANTVTAISEPAAGRYRDAVALLPDGGVLLAGSIAGGPPSDSVTIWYESAARDEWRPEIDAPPSPFSVGTSTELTGSGLFGVSEGVSSVNQSAASSPAGFFLLDGGGIIPGDVLDASATGFSWRPAPAVLAGTGLFFASTSGILGGCRAALSPGALGDPCLGLAACASGHCVDGVCCDGPCESTCLACSSAVGSSSTDGTCGPVVAGMEEPGCAVEPVETCGLDGTCNGAGECASYANGTVCGYDRICFGGRCEDASCDGDHTIVTAGEPEDCTPYRCSVEEGACLASCDDNLDCVEGYACDANSRCAEPAPADDALGCAPCGIGRGASGGASWAWLAGVVLLLLRRGQNHRARARARPLSVTNARMLAVLLVAGVVGCRPIEEDESQNAAPGATAAQPDTNALATLALRFPAAAPLLGGAREAFVGREGARLWLREGSAGAEGPWRPTRRSLEVQIARSGRMALRGRGAEVSVERAGVAGVELGDGHLVFRDAAGASAGALFATPRGIEEVVVGSGPLRYEVSLPAGWHLRQPAGRHELIELRDARGTPQLRFEARWAFDEEGGRHRLRVRIDGDALVVEAPADRGPLLIDPEWIDAGVPSSDRTGAMVATLSDGRVLLVGGTASADDSTSADLFDPATFTFNALPPANHARAQGTATLLDDGRVLLAGGPLRGSPAPIELFDPEAESFLTIETELRPGGVEHTATKLAAAPHAGKVLIAGGLLDVGAMDANARADVFLFDPATDTIVSAGSMSEPRGSHRAVLLENGEILFVGGLRAQGASSSLERYDLATLTSSGIAGTLPSERHATTALLLPQLGGAGQLLLSGGLSGRVDSPRSDVWLHDLATEQWTLVGTLERARGRIYAALLPNGDALLLGGGESPTALVPAGAERFDAATSTLTALPAPPGEFAVTTGALLPSGDHLIVGGTEGPLVFVHEQHRRVDVVDTMDTPMREPSVTVLTTGEVLLTEGEAAAELFDPDTRTFTALPGGPPGIAGCHPATTLLDGRVLFTGGLPGPLASTAAALFDPTTRAFASVGPMTQPRAAHVQALLPDGRVLLIGGLVGEDIVTARAMGEVFDPAATSFVAEGITLDPIVWGQAMMLADGNLWLWGSTSGLGPYQAITIDPSALTISKAPGSPPTPGLGVRVSSGELLFSSPEYLRLFDPTLAFRSEFFTDECTLSTEWLRPAAAVPLGSGRALLVGSETQQLCLIDPATGAVSNIAEPAAMRYRDAVALLPDGGVLLAGAIGDGPPSDSVSIWYESEPRPEWRPKLNAPPQALSAGDLVPLTGERLLGVSEGVSAASQSPASTPTAFFVFDDGGIVRGDTVGASDAGFSWRPGPSPFTGTGQLFVSTMGLLEGHRGIFNLGALGAPCGHDAGCATGHCADGVCCDKTCADLCRACSIAHGSSGPNGTCDTVVAGTLETACAVEPVVTCGFDGTCDAAGACALYPQGTPCDDGRICVEGTCQDELCDGDHTLVTAGESRDCTPYRCSVDEAACLTSCDDNLDCVEGYACDAYGRCAEPSPGAEALGCAPCGIGREASRASWAWLAALALALHRRRRTPRASSASASLLDG